MWSNHGTNFVGAARELKELHEFCDCQGTKYCLATFCSEHGILWYLYRKMCHTLEGCGRQWSKVLSTISDILWVMCAPDV